MSFGPIHVHVERIALLEIERLSRGARTRASTISRRWSSLRFHDRKGKPARLRARRTREEITISERGPLPRSHSPPYAVEVTRDRCREAPSNVPSYDSPPVTKAFSA